MIPDNLRCEKVNVLGVRCSRAHDHERISFSECLFELPSDEVILARLEEERLAGAAEEREACAALAKSLRLTGPNLAPAMADYIVDAIRARAT